jgi:hypothetical protein
MEQDLPIPVTISQAAGELERDAPLVRMWASRYRARLVRKIGKRAWYDLRDLSTIEGCLHRGEKPPATPEDRDDLRARNAAAA